MQFLRRFRILALFQLRGHGGKNRLSCRAVDQHLAGRGKLAPDDRGMHALRLRVKNADAVHLIPKQFYT